MSVIITLGRNISRGDTFFYDWVKQTELGKISHVLKNLHGEIIMDSFERCFHEGYLERTNISNILYYY